MTTARQSNVVALALTVPAISAIPDRGLAREVAVTTATAAAEAPGLSDLGRRDLGWLQIDATADLPSAHLNQVGLPPTCDRVTTSVWRSSGRDVDFAMADGEVLVRSGMFVRRHEEGLIAAGGARFRKVWDRKEECLHLGPVFESPDQREAKDA